MLPLSTQLNPQADAHISGAGNCKDRGGAPTWKPLAPFSTERASTPALLPFMIATIGASVYGCEKWADQIRRRSSAFTDEGLIWGVMCFAWLPGAPSRAIPSEKWLQLVLRYCEVC